MKHDDFMRRSLAVAHAARWLAIPLAAGIATAAIAQQPALPPSLLACAVLGHDVERLACYDRAVAGLRSGNTDAASAVAPAPEELFGVHGQLTQKARNEKRPERQDLQTISARVTRIDSIGDLPVIELDNGQTWKATSGDATALLRVGDSVTISRAAFGSFRLATSYGRFAKVKRIR